MAYEFENREVWQRALDYAGQIHEIAEQLPKHERYNLADRMTHAANSIPLNVAAQDYLFTPFRAQPKTTSSLAI